jgi:hypothetical protein
MHYYIIPEKITQYGTIFSSKINQVLYTVVLYLVPVYFHFFLAGLEEDPNPANKRSSAELVALAGTFFFTTTASAVGLLAATRASCSAFSFLAATLAANAPESLSFRADGFPPYM